MSWSHNFIYLFTPLHVILYNLATMKITGANAALSFAWSFIALTYGSVQSFQDSCDSIFGSSSFDGQDGISVAGIALYSYPSFDSLSQLHDHFMKTNL